MSVRAMKRGAMDFLPKPFRDQDMLDAVMVAIERDRQRRAADGDASRMRQRFETLTAREQQVMMLVTTGKMNKQVAGDLGITEITVKLHRGAAMRKMGARTLADGRTDPGRPRADGRGGKAQGALNVGLTYYTRV